MFELLILVDTLAEIMLINDIFMAVNNAIARENLFLYNVVIFWTFQSYL